MSPDEVRQTVLAHDVFRMGRRGLPVDVPYVKAHKAAADAEREKYVAALDEAGLIGPGSRTELQRLLKENGVTKLPKRRATDTREPSGLLASDGKTLRATGDERLIALADFHAADKKFQLWDAFDTGTDIIRAWWRPLVASGRVSCSGPNLTQVPRVGGFREAVRAPDGKCFVIMDFAALEFRVWAATCQRWLGFSEACKFLWDRPTGKSDVHAIVAKAVMEVVGGDFATRRQQCKNMNYGLIGGMSDARLAETLKCSLDEARQLKRLWMSIFWEFQSYKNRALSRKVAYPKCEVTLPSGRVRVAFPTEILNVIIQGGGADVTKETLHLAEKRGLPTVNFPHDEFIELTDPRHANEVGQELLECAKEAGEMHYPEVPWDENEFEITDHWHSKKA